MKFSDSSSLGKGRSGNVVHGIYTHGGTDKQVAIKTYSSGKFNIDRIKKEAGIAMQCLSSSISNSDYIAITYGLCFPAIVKVTDYKTEEEITGHIKQLRYSPLKIKNVFLINYDNLKGWQIYFLEKKNKLAIFPVESNVELYLYLENLNKKSIDGLKNTKTIAREVTFLLGYTYFDEDDFFQQPQYYLIMEYLPLGSLADYLKDSKDHFKINNLFRISLDICLGLNALHTNSIQPIFHRDLKSANILLRKENGEIRAKLSDFGLATEEEKARPGLVGSSQYMAPEIKNRQAATSQSDIFSLGKVLKELWNNGFEIISNIQKLINLCCSEQPYNRPTLGKIIFEFQKSAFSHGLRLKEMVHGAVKSFPKEWVEVDAKEYLPHSKESGESEEEEIEKENLLVFTASPTFAPLLLPSVFDNKIEVPRELSIIVDRNENIDDITQAFQHNQLSQELNFTPEKINEPAQNISENKQGYVPVFPEKLEAAFIPSIVEPPISPSPSNLEIKLIPDPAYAIVSRHQKLLQLVTNGEQMEAEALIEINKELLLTADQIKDPGGREFLKITAFQYALWALDWRMWTMLLKYLTPQIAYDQLLELEAKPPGDSPHFSLEPLINALNGYKENKNNDYNSWKKIGIYQRQLVINVVNEYCHPERDFDKVPTFTEEAKEKPFPRSQKVDKEGRQEWFTAEIDGGKLGVTFAFARGHYKKYPIADSKKETSIKDLMAVSFSIFC